MCSAADINIVRLRSGPHWWWCYAAFWTTAATRWHRYGSV